MFTAFWHFYSLQTDDQRLVQALDPETQACSFSTQPRPFIRRPEAQSLKIELFPYFSSIKRVDSTHFKVIATKSTSVLCLRPQCENPGLCALLTPLQSPESSSLNPVRKDFSDITLTPCTGYDDGNPVLTAKFCLQHVRQSSLGSGKHKMDFPNHSTTTENLKMVGWGEGF